MTIKLWNVYKEDEEEETFSSLYGWGELRQSLEEELEEEEEEEEEIKEEPKKTPPSFLGSITSLWSSIFADDELWGKWLSTRMREANKEAQRNKEQARIAEIDSRYWYVKNEETWKWRERTFRERFIWKTAAWLWQLAWEIEDVFSPVSWTLNYMLMSRYEDYDDRHQWQSWILEAVWWITEALWTATRATLEFWAWKELTEAEKISAEYAGWELWFDVAGGVLWKWLSSLKNVPVKKILSKTKTTTDIDIETAKLTQEFEQKANFFDEGKTDTTELKDIIEKMYLLWKDWELSQNDVTFFT